VGRGRSRAASSLAYLAKLYQPKLVTTENPWVYRRSVYKTYFI